MPKKSFIFFITLLLLVAPFTATSHKTSFKKSFFGGVAIGLSTMLCLMGATTISMGNASPTKNKFQQKDTHNYYTITGWTSDSAIKAIKESYNLELIPHNPMSYYIWGSIEILAGIMLFYAGYKAIEKATEESCATPQNEQQTSIINAAI